MELDRQRIRTSGGVLLASVGLLACVLAVAGMARLCGASRLWQGLWAIWILCTAGWAIASYVFQDETIAIVRDIQGRRTESELDFEYGDEFEKTGPDLVPVAWMAATKTGWIGGINPNSFQNDPLVLREFQPPEGWEAMSLEEKLLAQRAEVVAAHQLAEKTRDSGWHPADPGVLQMEKRGETPLSERPVCFLDDDQVHVCGPDVKLVLDAAKEWLVKFKPLALLPDTRADIRYAVKCIERVLARPAAPVLTVFAQEWNSLNLALGLSRPDKDGNPQGIQVVSTALKV